MKANTYRAPRATFRKWIARLIRFFVVSLGEVSCEQANVGMQRFTC